MSKSKKKTSTKKSGAKFGDKRRKQAIAEIDANIKRIEATERGETPAAVTAAVSDGQRASTKRTKRRAGAKTTTKQKKEKAAKKLSGLDAAAKVLAESKDPMTAQDIVKGDEREGPVVQPRRQTPHATIYAAMIREIGTKGKESRFVKVERGMFAAGAQA